MSEYYHGLISTHPDCHLCPLRFKAKVLPDGPVPARIAFVGEAPGRMEQAKGKGFVGPSGQLLWQHLGPACGFTREEVWVTNGILCQDEDVLLTTGAVLPRDTVRKMAAEHCHRRLIDELTVVNPTVIVPLGTVALHQLLGKKHAGIYGYRGSISEVNLAEIGQRLAAGLPA